MTVRAWLDPPLPSSIDPGGGVCLLIRGAFEGAPIAAVTAVSLGDSRDRPRVWLPERHGRRGSHRPGRFWALIDISTRDLGTSPLRLYVRTRDGRAHTVECGDVCIARERQSQSEPAQGAPIAICLATHAPDPALLKGQIASLRAQTYFNWTAVVVDDATPDTAAVTHVLSGDQRFTLLPGRPQAGSYRAFERAVAAVPDQAKVIAYCDQDDRWWADKLERLVPEVPDRGLACCDARVVAPDGAVYSPTFWTTRRHLPGDLRSILIANSVPGNTMLWDARLRDVVLPFPPQLEHLHHDGWVAAAAAAQGGIRRLAAPLVDYVQHDANVLGHFAAVNPRIGRLGRREAVLATLLPGARRYVAETQIDAALRPEALARTIALRLASAGRAVPAQVVFAARPDDSIRRMVTQGRRALSAAGRHGLPGTELAVGRGHLAIRLARSRARRLVSG